MEKVINQNTDYEFKLMFRLYFINDFFRMLDILYDEIQTKY